MNAKIFFTVATALIAIASAASAVARDNNYAVSGQSAFEISTPATSTLTRAQVRAETLEAIRLGVINFGRDYGSTGAPTVEPLESIRMAGQKALLLVVASR